MTLNKQLLCVSLLLLSIPWAGCQYLREMDAALRDSQQQTLEATATVIAQSLAIFPEQLDPHGQAAPVETADNALYCHPLSQPVMADGYFEEWGSNGSNIPWAHYQSVDGQHQLRYRCGIYQEQLALSVTIVDNEVIYNNPTQSLVEHGDRLVLATGEREYIFTASAPGAITSRYWLNPHTTYRESRIESSWIDNEQGYQLEIKLPLKLAAQRLSFYVIDETSASHTRFGPGLENRLNDNTPPPRFVYQAPATEALLQRFAQPGMRLRLTNPQGLLTASVGQPMPQQQASAHWLLRKLYRAILSDSDAASYYIGGIDLSQRQEFQNFNTSRITSHWYRDPDYSGYQLLSSVVPILHNGEVIALLFAEQSSERTAALTDRAFTHLFGLSLAVIAGSVLILLSYASWLSWRIRRLSRATQQAINEQGQIQHHLPESRAQDEIGVLHRNYAELIKRIAEYTEYLQNLSRKLSHELRTPLAIIHSSLDNLSQQASHSTALSSTALTYQQRAKEGANRLGTILTAMSEARRVEESIDQAESEVIDLYALLSELTQAYQDIYPAHRIEFRPYDKALNQLQLKAVPDLIVQMLDKLVENATSFCPEQGSIQILVNREKDTVKLAVSNDGPLLPEAMQAQLFDNMVSLRSNNDSNIHLGLGLHIVKLIVNYHYGNVKANNREDGSGVIFTISLPAT